MYSIEELRTIFTTYLNSKSFQEVPKKLYEPNNYFLQIGGKRLRPVLLLLATDLFGGDIKKSFPAALSIEYFHNFTLIHDDVMDDAPLRRGFQTIHTKYSLNTAILSGDVLLVKAYQCLSEIEEVYFKKIFDIYTKTAIEVCEGQQLDIDFETDENVTQEDYISMIRLKTSVLVAASMKIGAIIGGASDEDADFIYQYAENLGIAFQIHDDILDCFGNHQLVGKQIGGDIIQNKKTLLLIEALKRSTQANDLRLANWLDLQKFDAVEKVNAVTAIFKKYNMEEFGREQRNIYVQKAMNALSLLNLKEDKKKILRELVDYLVVRNA